MPVVRNPQFYFKEGFCWNNVLNPKTRLLKVKLKQASVNDVGSMSLIPTLNIVPSKYIIALLNSNLLFDYYREFINCTVNVQINDIRLMPIIIPTTKVLEKFISLTNKVISLKNSKCSHHERDLNFKEELYSIEMKLDSLVNDLYII